MVEDVGLYFSLSRFVLYIVCLGRAGVDIAILSNNPKLRNNPLGFILQHIMSQYPKMDGRRDVTGAFSPDKTTSGRYKGWTPEPARRDNSPDFEDSGGMHVTFSPTRHGQGGPHNTTHFDDGSSLHVEGQPRKITEGTTPLEYTPGRTVRTQHGDDFSGRSPGPHRSPGGAVIEDDVVLRGGSERDLNPDSTLDQGAFPSRERIDYQGGTMNTPNRNRDWVAQRRAEYSQVLNQSANNTSPGGRGNFVSPDMPRLGAASRRVIASKLDKIKRIFTAYSSYGISEPNMLLSSSNFHKLLKDSAIVRSDVHYADMMTNGRVPVGTYLDYIDSHKAGTTADASQHYIDYRDAELIFMEFSRGDPIFQSSPATPPRQDKSIRTGSTIDRNTEKIISNSMNLEDFINALHYIAIKCYPHEEEHKAVAHLIDYRLRKLLETDLVKTGFQDLAYVAKLKYILTDPPKLRMLAVLYKNIQPYYTLYTNHNRMMDFKCFCLFFKDFGIYPTLISLNILQKYFAALASLDVGSIG